MLSRRFYCFTCAAREIIGTSRWCCLGWPLSPSLFWLLFIGPGPCDRHVAYVFWSSSELFFWTFRFFASLEAIANRWLRFLVPRSRFPRLFSHSTLPIELSRQRHIWSKLVKWNLLAREEGRPASTTSYEERNKLAWASFRQPRATAKYKRRLFAVVMEKMSRILNFLRRSPFSLDYFPRGAFVLHIRELPTAPQIAPLPYTYPRRVEYGFGRVAVGGRRVRIEFSPPAGAFRFCLAGELPSGWEEVSSPI